MAALEPESLHSVVTDPPYELGFMGKAWDRADGVASDALTWDRAKALLKPGGHVFAFAGSRTYHRIAMAIDRAGFEIRDQYLWLYGSGFPKSHDIAKAIDKAGGGYGAAELHAPSLTTQSVHSGSTTSAPIKARLSQARPSAGKAGELRRSPRTSLYASGASRSVARFIRTSSSMALAL